MKSMKIKQWIAFCLGILSIPEAFAVAAPVSGGAAEAGGSGALAQGLMLAAFAVIFYFVILRPQSKRAKEHKNLVTGLQKGDEVITTGGLLGKINRIADNFFVIMIADNVEVTIQKQAIVGSVPKGTLKSI